MHYYLFCLFLQNNTYIVEKKFQDFQKMAILENPKMFFKCYLAALPGMANYKGISFAALRGVTLTHFLLNQFFQ